MIEQYKKEKIEEFEIWVRMSAPSGHKVEIAEVNFFNELLTKKLQTAFDEIEKKVGGEKEVQDFEMFFETLNEIREILDRTDREATKYIDAMIKNYNPALTNKN